MKKQAHFVNSGGPLSGSPELLLTFCGYDVWEAGTQYPPRQEQHYTLYALRRGKAVCTVGGVPYDLEAQDILVIFPGMEASFQADPELGCTCLWIGLSGTQAENYLRHGGFSREAPMRKSQCLHRMEKILVQALLPQPALSNQLRAMGYLQLFLGDLMEEYTPTAPEEALDRSQASKATEYVKNAIDYISKHYPENVKIKELADFVGISRSYLASSFKTATGYSPKEYLLSLRLEKAKSLLETTQMSISSISSAIGYEDPLAFSRIFKHYSGLSPTDYREAYLSRFDIVERESNFK